MQLSKLEIKGFKSFGDKVVLNFDEGITGVVGPNGCGKSNIVDAIRWVLGEQKTRMLRSDKMENVIFNGTKNRKPLQMAEVSLTFNNTKNLLPTEYSQVTITRRYYRSGESEYLLNNVTCRLKDITDLFLDTGIGPDSYAIIELKMVEEMITDRENSRRTLFEEAAGISKFKKRKKDSLRKLEETDKDLERVEDLLFEVNKNMKSLEKQAKQTEKYYQIKEEYKNASVELAKVSIKGQREELISLNKRIEESTDRKTQLNAQVAEKESENEKVKADQIIVEQELAVRQKALNEHVNGIRSFESDKKIKNERLKFLNDKGNSLREQIELDMQSNERAQFSIESLDKERESAEKILAEAEAKLETYKQEFEDQKTQTTALQEEVNRLNSQYKLKQDEVFQLKKNLEINDIQLSTLKQELEKTAVDSSAHHANLEEFDSKIKEIEGSLNAKKAELEDLQKQEEEYQQKIVSLETEIESIKDKVTQINRKIDQKQNEFNLLKDMVENLEGFPEAIKFLKKNANWGKDFLLLSDILTSEEKYRLSLENYLEPFMNYYVVDNEAQAIQAVNLLSDAAKGKANFFVLSKFQNFNPAPVKQYSNCIAAVNIADYDSKYQKLISYLLDSVYIITDRQDDIPQEDGAVFITQNGKITKRKYSISGGSVGLFEGKRIGRAKNLENLETEIRTLTVELGEAKDLLDRKQKDLFELKENTLKAQIEELRHETSLINNEYITIKTKHEQLLSMLNSNSLRSEDINERIQKIQEEIALNQPKLEEQQQDLHSLEENLVLMGDELNLNQTQLSNKSATFNQHNLFFHQQQNKVTNLDNEISYKRSSFEQSKERIDKNQEELKGTDEEIKGMIEHSDVHEDELVELYKEKETLEGVVNETSAQYYNMRNRVNEIETEVRELRREREETDQTLINLQTTINESKMSLSSIRERLSVEFEINIDDLLAQEEEEGKEYLSYDELKEKADKIKNQIDRIGPINPMALEAFTEVQERHKFITEQKEDLIKAKDSLMTTINEIESVARVSFLETFDKIRENFILVFRSLFTEEDTCDLKLVDPEHPLESAIEIIARPKGKRPLTLTQLSGGEKTLTAISLLFAIYLIKPAPFCIFDEVDAPLDDANIDKFNNIIRTFSKESQFIIVTHNKRTMSSTDVIYGITMVEQGVSRLVPVDLRSLAE